MKLPIPVIAYLLACSTTFIYAESPPPNYMSNSYDNGQQGQSNYGNEGQQGGGYDFDDSDGGNAYGSANDGQNEVDGGYQGGNNGGSGGGGDYAQSIPYDNSYKGLADSYAPPAPQGGGQSFGPTIMYNGPPRRKRPGFMFRFPKIRIATSRRVVKKVPPPSNSYSSYPEPNYGGAFSQGGFGQGQSNFDGAYGSPMSQNFGGGSNSYDGPPSNGLYSNFDSSSNSYGGGPNQGQQGGFVSGSSSYAPNAGYGSGGQKGSSYGKGPPNQYGYDESSNVQNEGQGGGFNQNQYNSGSGNQQGGFGGSQSKPKKQVRPYRSGGSGPKGYGNGGNGPQKQSSNQYGSYGSGGGGGSYSNSFSQGPSKQFGPMTNQGNNYVPKMEGYVRGKSYTKFMPPVKGQSYSSKPIPMGSRRPTSFGDDDDYSSSDFQNEGFDSLSDGPQSNFGGSGGGKSKPKYALGKPLGEDEYKSNPDGSFSSQASQWGDGNVASANPGSDFNNDFSFGGFDDGFEDETRHKRRPVSGSYATIMPKKQPRARGQGYPKPYRQSSGSSSSRGLFGGSGPSSNYGFMSFDDTQDFEESRGTSLYIGKP